MNCNASELLSSACRFQCLPRKTLAAVKSYLLLQWLKKKVAIEPLSWSPETETATWTDKNGEQSGDLEFFNANADISSVSKFSMSFTDVESVSGLSSIFSVKELDFSHCTSLKSISNTDLIKSLTFFTAKSSTELIAIAFDGLESVSSYIELSGCIKLASASFAKLVTIGSLTFSDCRLLETINFPLLQSISDGCDFGSCKILQTISLPSLLSVAVSSGTFSVVYTSHDFPLLETVSAPKLQSCGPIKFSRATMLKALTLGDGNTALWSDWFATYVGAIDFPIVAYYGSIDQASLDSILICANLSGLDNSKGNFGMELSGYLNSVPSAAGLAAKAALESRGVQVFINS